MVNHPLPQVVLTREMNRFVFLLVILVLVSGGFSQPLRISSDHRYFTQNGRPFFWLGDTGWLLFVKCTREETIKYLDKRRQQGFNVVQVMVLHDLKKARNIYGDDAVKDRDVSKPVVTPGSDPRDAEQYDFWDHIDWVVGEAAKRGMYAALVPVWGSNVKDGSVNEKQAAAYAKFLAERYKNKPNIIWLNGGDLRGDQGTDVWKTIGSTLRKYGKNHLITFHPRGRTSSSEWFHDEAWLDFNMFQSGHRNYEQDNSPGEHHFGEDNWRYTAIDYALKPVKPVLDGEPSYENIPQGLHDPKMPRWNDADVRRYAYWSVFAGGAGFTYGENSMIQFYEKGDKDPAYGAEIDWRESINSPGANQMRFLKKLMLSKPYFERVPANEIVADQGERYQYITATRGRNYAFLYSYVGRMMKVKMGFLPGKTVKFKWFDPRVGAYLKGGSAANSGTATFDPPGEEKAGNDWILVLER